MLLPPLLLGGCFEELDVVYKIAEGQHYSTPLQAFIIDSNPLVFYATFDESAKCPSEDINKLFGFSDCNSTIHNDSARFGWRWMDNKLEVFSYTYCNGTKTFSYITTVPLDKEIRYTIKMDKYRYIFTVNGVTREENRCNNCTTGTYISSHPYYGGDKPACQDIYIKVRMK